MQRSVLVGYGLGSGHQVMAQRREDGKIAVTTVLEDITLDLVIPFVGIVVQVLQPLPRLLVQPLVIVQVLTVPLHRIADVRRHGKTDITVDPGLLIHLRKAHHLLQTAYQTVVTGNLGIVLLDEPLQGEGVPCELLELLRGLMTGVGEVEHILRSLGIQHQRVLVTQMVGLTELLHDTLVPGCRDLTALFQFVMFIHQLLSEDGQRSVDILFLENSHRLFSVQPAAEYQ